MYGRDSVLAKSRMKDRPNNSNCEAPVAAQGGSTPQGVGQGSRRPTPRLAKGLQG